ncbi:MAG: hypothetical protein N2044_02245 [Cyclobacteriaceae bacterium]|nr:hypothetical protein [Cyclobacteriaceae bacterium]MCX7636646.1 hypothetical protein [Cyclobacteriaceae bacterium]
MVEDLEDIIHLLYHASSQKLACRIQLDGEPFPRIVHPYGIFRTPRNRIMLVVWQERGYTKAGATAGYRNLDVRKLISVEALEEHFSKQPDFNPSDSQYAEWVYHI